MDEVGNPLECGSPHINRMLHMMQRTGGPLLLDASGGGPSCSENR